MMILRALLCLSIFIVCLQVGADTSVSEISVPYFAEVVMWAKQASLISWDMDQVLKKASSLGVSVAEYEPKAIETRSDKDAAWKTVSETREMILNLVAPAKRKICEDSLTLLQKAAELVQEKRWEWSHKNTKNLAPAILQDLQVKAKAAMAEVEAKQKTAQVQCAP